MKNESIITQKWFCLLKQQGGILMKNFGLLLPTPSRALFKCEDASLSTDNIILSTQTQYRQIMDFLKELERKEQQVKFRKWRPKVPVMGKYECFSFVYEIACRVSHLHKLDYSF